MKLHQFQTLVAVVDHGGIRAAARALHLSQAAVTKAMRGLEDEAGTPLLVRGSRGVDLTEAGQRLLARARVITHQVALAQDDLRQAGGDDGGTLRVGLTPFLNLTVLGEAFGWFRQRYQRVQLQVIEGLVARVRPRLRDGTLDLAAVAADAGELDGDRFVARHLLRLPQRLVVRAGHPVLADLQPPALAALEWVLTQSIVPAPTQAGADAGAPPADTGPGLGALFSRAGVPLPSRVLVCETLAAMTLLRHSDAISVFPAPLLGHPETRGIVAVDCPALQPADIDLLLLTRPDLPLTPAAAHFAHCLASVCAQRLGPG